MTNQVLRLPKVLAVTGISRASLYKFVSTGQFPRPIRLGPRSVAWVEKEVDDWIALRIAQRDAEYK